MTRGRPAGALNTRGKDVMFASLVRSGILVASVVLWVAGLRLFVGAELSRQRKLTWSGCLVVAGGLIGLALPAAQVWNKFQRTARTGTRGAMASLT
jgi:hypothetical protein